MVWRNKVGGSHNPREGGQHPGGAQRTLRGCCVLHLTRREKQVESGLGDVAEGRRGSLWVPPYPPWEPGDLRTQEILKKTKHLLVLRNTTMGV